MVEIWMEQASLDAHSGAAHRKQFLDTLRPLRFSDYDRRPYKTLTVGPLRETGDGRQVAVVTHVDTVPAPQSNAPGLLNNLAETSQKERGNLRFDVLQHATRANHFTTIEIWQNQNALDAHAAAAHTIHYREALQPYSGSPLDERLLQSC